MRGLDQWQRRLRVFAHQVQQPQPMQRFDRIGREQGAVRGLRGFQVLRVVRGAGLFQGCEHDRRSMPSDP